jgi:hypothetical protein
MLKYNKVKNLQMLLLKDSQIGDIIIFQQEIHHPLSQLRILWEVVELQD